jgi:hypothetical protein
MAEESRFAKGDLNGVMNAHPHVAEWVRDFEMQHGSRPIYYGPLDRDAKKQRPLNLIYVTKEPIFVYAKNEKNSLTRSLDFDVYRPR